MISLILLEPEYPSNIGAVARVMANFGFSQLVLINPKCNYLHMDAVMRAKKGSSILKKAKIKDFSYLKTFHTLIGTTAQLGTGFNLPRSPMTLEQLAELLEGKRRANIGLLFGRESIGLKNKEIAQCDFMVTIPAEKQYPTLNISHAVAVVLYVLHRKFKEGHTDHILLASKRDKEQILKMLNEVLDTLEFSKPEKKETQKKVWKRIVGKAFLTRKEASSLMGFLRKLQK
ncbi:RNA methyltransferase [Candidatus Woesearchaeota archaeon]|nr:RNA methyltransferase [Candidatus Woesearchaeota archaeon]